MSDELQPGRSGGGTPDASAVTYTPADGADWSNPDPTEAAAALDTLAARVVVLESAPGGGLQYATFDTGVIAASGTETTLVTLGAIACVLIAKITRIGGTTAATANVVAYDRDPTDPAAVIATVMGVIPGAGQAFPSSGVYIGPKYETGSYAMGLAVPLVLGDGDVRIKVINTDNSTSSQLRVELWYVTP